MAFIGKNKVGFIDVRYPKSHFGESLHEQWERVNDVVLLWIINSLRKDLLNNIIYASNDHNVLIDLKEMFNKVSGSRVFFCKEKL